MGGQAAASGKTHWLTYDLENAKFWTISPRTQKEEKSFGSAGFDSREDDQDRRGTVYGLGRGVRFLDVVIGEGDVRTKGELKFEFSALGLFPAHTVHLQYADNEELRLTVVVNPVTGECSILEGYESLGFVTAAETR